MRRPRPARGLSSQEEKKNIHEKIKLYAVPYY
jgi:hypothetical protein